MGNKAKQNKVDIARSKLCKEDLEEFDRLCQFNATYETLKSFLAERGQLVSIQNLSNWWIANRPRGKEAIAINAIAEHYDGANAKHVLEMALTISAKLALKLQEVINIQGSVGTASANSQLNNLVEILKELRQASSDLYNLESRKDSKESYEAGIYQMGEELIKIFKNSPIETSINTAVKSVQTRLLNE